MILIYTIGNNSSGLPKKCGNEVEVINSFINLLCLIPSYPLEGPEHVQAVAFSPDDKRLLTGGPDHTLIDELIQNFTGDSERFKMKMPSK